MESKISTKGQVVIPKEIRDKLGITPDDRLRIYDQNGKVIIEPILDASEDPWDGMEVLDIQDHEVDLVAAAITAMGKKFLSS